MGGDERGGVDGEIAGGKGFAVEVQGHSVEYDAERQSPSCMGKNAALRTIDGRVRLQLLVDRTSLEIFGNNGEVSMSFCFLPEAANHRLVLSATDRGVRIVTLIVHELRSAWEVG